MVIRARDSDWQGMRKLLENGEGEEGLYEAGAVGNGSFDGADQGLLNEWFSETGGGGVWNRLPFTLVAVLYGSNVGISLNSWVEQVQRYTDSCLHIRACLSTIRASDQCSAFHRTS